MRRVSAVTFSEWQGPVWHRARALSHLRLTAEQQNKKITPQFLIRYKPYFAVRLHQPLLKMFTSTVIARCCIQIDCNNTGTVGTFQEAGVTLHWFAFFSSFLRDAMKKTPNTHSNTSRVQQNKKKKYFVPQISFQVEVLLRLFLHQNTLLSITIVK